MGLEHTLSIIKPDAVEAKKSGHIIGLLEENGFEIIAKKKITLKREEAEKFYSIHKDRPFFNELVNFMTSGPVVVQVLEKENAVSDYRKIMGDTNPEMADKNTIRNLYGKNIQCNAVHGSDSITNAKKEVSFFFSEIELFS
ncbi:MAG: nucleoside-diphosphate kinase [Rickettsiales bacterium]|nr:nucleoside-diphosphate kinase [Rickettsiales bacterium]|tara:strand:- start:2309 stop:2731 length:423 start_codon:yes stop_codon:yes gene_type:complete